MKYKNYYEILNINRKSTRDEIRNSFRKLAKKYHPDTNKTPEAESMFKDINEAYDVLTNDEKRRKYDRQVAKYGYGIVDTDSSLSNVKYEFKSGVNVINDLLNTILGFKKDDAQNFGDINNAPSSKDERKTKQKPEKGKDIISNIEVSLEEGFFGTEKKIAIKSYKTGLNTFSVNIPIGIQNGDCIRLAALGNPGKNGGKNGDLFIKINIVNGKKYQLDGKDLYTTIPITPWEAALGTRLQIDSIDDSKTQIYIPNGVQAGEIVKIPEKGYKTQDGKRGELIGKIEIVVPEKLTQEEKEVFKKLKEISKFNPRRV